MGYVVAGADRSTTRGSAAVAGGLVGIDEVIRAKAVLEAVREQVDTVAGYANW